MEKGFGIGDANIFDLQNVFNPVKKFASDVIADVKENKADLFPYMGIGATTDIAGFPADIYNLYGQLRKGVGSPTLASILGPEIEKIAGSEALLENISPPALKQMGIEPKRGTYTEDLGRILGIPGGSLAVKAGTDISKGLGEVALKALKSDEVAITPEGFAMPVPKDSSVLEMSGKASGVGQYSDELTKQIEGLADTNPDIYQSAQAMIKGNNPEDRIKKMIESRLAPKQKILTEQKTEDLNFVPVAKTFPEDPKMYLEQNYKYKDPNVTRNETSNLFNSRMNYNNQPYSLEERNKFVRERPIHFNSVVLARKALTDSPDGRLTGKEIYNKIKNAQLKAGEEFNVDTGKLKISYAGVRDKELKDTGLNKLKDNDDIFELSPDQQTLINLSNPEKIDPSSSALLSPKLGEAAKTNISLRQNQIVSRSNFISDYGGRPNPTKIGEDDFDQIPFTETEQFYVGESYPRMFEDNQRIGGENLAKQESLDYGIISINDPNSDFKAHIKSDVPSEIAKGNIAWSRVSVREHPNGKKYLVPEEFQSDLHTKAKGTSPTRPGIGYKASEEKIQKLTLDQENKFYVFEQEKRNLENKVFDDTNEEEFFLDSYPKSNYSVMGKNANDLIDLKSSFEDAIVESLADPNFKEFNNDITRSELTGVARFVSRVNKNFNEFTEFASRSRPIDSVTEYFKSKKINPAHQKYIKTKKDLAEKIFEKKYGISPKENNALVISKIQDYNKKRGIKAVLDPEYELDNIENNLELSMKEAVNTNDYGFSNVSSLHSNITDLTDGIDGLPEIKKSIYLNTWKTIQDLKKDPEFKNVEYKDTYVRNKFFENADPTGELEIKEVFDLNNIELEFEVLMDSVEQFIDDISIPDSDVRRNIDYLSHLGDRQPINSSGVFKLDGDFNVLEKYFDAKDNYSEATEKLTSAQSSDLPYSPLPEQGEWTKVLMRDLVRTAADRGLDGVVLPNAQAYRYAGGRSDELIRGYKNTTIPTFKSVAKEIGEDVDTIEWKGWTSGGQGEAHLTDLADNNHLVIPVNKNLSGTSTRGYKEGGQVGSLANVNVLDLGERVNG